MCLQGLKELLLYLLQFKVEMSHKGAISLIHSTTVYKYHFSHGQEFESQLWQPSTCCGLLRDFSQREQIFWQT